MEFETHVRVLCTRITQQDPGKEIPDLFRRQNAQGVREQNPLERPLYIFIEHGGTHRDGRSVLIEGNFDLLLQDTHLAARQQAITLQLCDPVVLLPMVIFDAVS